MCLGLSLHSPADCTGHVRACAGVVPLPLFSIPNRQVNMLTYVSILLFTLLLGASACGDTFTAAREKPSAPPHSERATEVYRLTQTSAAATTPPGTAPASPTASPAVTDTEMAVLQHAAEELNCSPHLNIFGEPGVSIEGAVHTYHYGCTAAAGHGTAIQIKRYARRADAQTAFETKCEGRPIQPFHGYPACEWLFDENADNPQFPMRHRFHVWLTDRWLVVVKAFDDTHYAIAPEPLRVSEAVYRAARARGMFPAE